MSKNMSAVRSLYNARIKILQARENAVLASMAPQAKQAVNDLLSLTSESAQNKQLDDAISKIETLISMEYITQFSGSAEQLQQQIAQEILALDSQLQVIGHEGAQGLVDLANGNYSGVIAKGGGVTLVNNSDLNNWIVKIMKRIADVKAGDSKKFTGYLSNLKGEYLEQAVLAQLKKRIPSDIEVAVQGGTMRADQAGGRGRQIEEDIFLIYDDGGRIALDKAFSNIDYRTKSNRISIPVDLYSEIQAGAAGISVKAGNAPIKFYEGKLNLFFDAGLGDQDVDNYRTSVLLRSVAVKEDGNEAILNRYVVALRLDEAVGSNNLFLATRNKLLTTMSKELEVIRDSGMLSMYYNIKSCVASKAKLGKNATISGRIVAPRH